MKLQVKDDPKEGTQEQEDPKDPVPGEPTPVEPEVTPEPEEPVPAPDETQALKLELAELKGQISVLRDSKKDPVDSEEQKALQAKQRVMADANTLGDDQFQDLYKMSKLQAVNSVNQYDSEQRELRSSIKIAELEAKSELVSKYPSFAKHYENIRKVISDLSPDARKDPERLKKAFEREYLYLSKDDKNEVQPKSKKETESMDRRRISNDFERPTINPNRSERKTDDDLVAVEDRALAAQFGIHKESERKKFMSPYIPMDLGVDIRDKKRIIFEDPKRGPVKVANS